MAWIYNKNAERNNIQKKEVFSMSIKLICIDMDGTLLMDQQNVAEEDKKAIKEAVKREQ